MRLRVILPREILLDREVAKVVAEAENGSFCLLPRHQDMVAGLVPSIVSFTADGEESFLAVDEGVLVKCGPEVEIVTPRGIYGPKLGELRQAVDEQFLSLTGQEREARVALERLEAGLMRQVLEWEDPGNA